MNRIWKPALTVAMIVATCSISLSAFAGSIPGDDLYKSKCAACHGPDGVGNTAMGKALKLRDLDSADVQKQADDELNRIITKGKGKMPAFDGKIKKEQIGELVGYLRALDKTK